MGGAYAYAVEIQCFNEEGEVVLTHDSSPEPYEKAHKTILLLERIGRQKEVVSKVFHQDGAIFSRNYSSQSIKGAQPEDHRIVRVLVTKTTSDERGSCQTEVLCSNSYSQAYIRKSEAVRGVRRYFLGGHMKGFVRHHDGEVSELKAKLQQQGFVREENITRTSSSR